MDRLVKQWTLKTLAAAAAAALAPDLLLVVPSTYESDIASLWGETK
jgi:hypothetical protein